jgi:hypothetical protein
MQSSARRLISQHAAPRSASLAVVQDYTRFLDIWKDADADLAPLVEARREYARLAAPRQ